VGSPEEDRSQVFERFYKADKARERETEGSGLGLAIAKKIVDLHGGTIDFESAPRVGKSFTVTLPLDEETRGRLDDPKTAAKLANR
jgi:signal transduction histidine kinase